MKPVNLQAPKKPVDIFVVAGEHSGDEHSAKMVQSFKELNPQAHVAALGGKELERAGSELLLDMTAFSIVGFIEVIKHYNFFKSLLDKTVRWIEEHQPKVVCLVDYPGFNLRLAEALYKRGISQKGGGAVKVIYYISPQIWAWKAGRRFKMAKHLDSLAVLFPFEVDCYKDTELPVSFVGHPFVAEGYELPIIYNKEAPIALLPGSRKGAVRRIFPVMLEAFKLLLKRHPKLNATVMYPTEPILRILKEQLESSGIDPDIIDFKQSGTRTHACAFMGSSGTMSLNCALASLPGAIIYKLNSLTYLLAQLVAKVDYIAIENILLGRAMHPEFIQSNADPRKIAEHMESCLGGNKKALEDQQELRELLSQETMLSSGMWLSTFLS